MPESSATIFLCLSETEKSHALVIQTRRNKSLNTVSKQTID